MAAVPSVFQGLIQTAESTFKAAVSEYTQNRIAANLNTLYSNAMTSHLFKMNGGISGFVSHTGVDGIFTFPFNAAIYQVFAYLETPGSSGTMTLDLKVSPFGTNTYTSIFTTAPSIQYTAAASTSIYVGSSVANTTAPVLTSSPILVNQFDQIKMDVLSMQSGSPQNGGLQIFFYPR